MNAIFLSDLHLKKMNESNSQKLLLFFNRIKKNPPQKIFLLGDIFDLWIYNHKPFLKEYLPLIRELKILSDSGVEVHYFEGNHDLYLKKFWQDTLGFNVHENFFCIEINGKWFRLEHGDQMNRKDYGYLFLRWFLRTWLISTLIKVMPGKFVFWLGNLASGSSRVYTSSDVKKVSKDKAIEIIHDHAKKSCFESYFDFIITGHVHIEDDYTFFHEGRRVRSINLGAWFDQAKVLTWNGIDFNWEVL